MLLLYTMNVVGVGEQKLSSAQLFWVVVEFLEVDRIVWGEAPMTYATLISIRPKDKERIRVPVNSRQMLHTTYESGSQTVLQLQITRSGS